MKNETLTVGQNPLPLLSYDGKYMGFHYQFSERDEQSPSYGTTFLMPIAEFTLEGLLAKRQAKAEQFRACALL